MEEGWLAIFLCALFMYSAEGAPLFTVSPPKTFFAVEGENITLEWKYTFSKRESFRQALFVKGNLQLADKHATDATAWIKTAYKGRLDVNMTNHYTSITLLRVKRAAKGSYTLHVIDNPDRERNSSVVEISVLYLDLPNITSTDTRPVEGSDVTLSCDVSGEPMPTISWTVNGSPLDTSSNSRISFMEDNKNLIIANVNRRDSGEYRCVANNSLGNVSSNASTLSVQYKPEIRTVPRLIQRTEGDELSLFCNFTGNPVPTISWTKNGFSLDTSNNSRINFSNKGKQLTIKNVSKEDGGVYLCVAENSLGNATSYGATLKVHFEPEVSIDGNQKQYVAKGADIRLICRYEASPPVSEVQWIKDRTVIARNASKLINGSRVTIPSFNESQIQLSITAASLRDGGNYTCNASNIFSSIQDTTMIIIGDKPEISTHPHNVTTEEGHDVTFYCNATGNPAPTISWTKYGNPVSNGYRIILSPSHEQFTITNVNRIDGGQYKCQAKNRVGTDTSYTSTVNVQYQAEIVSHPQAIVTEEEGSNLTLFCNATGNPAASISWTKHGSLINSNSRINFSEDNKPLNIRNVNRNDKGSYRCVATNSLGNDTSGVSTVDIQYRPEIVTQPQNVTETEGKTVTLPCNATGNPEPELSWFNDEHLVKSSKRISLSAGNQSLIIANVNRTDSGKYLCVAHNEVGNASSKIAVLNVQYRPEIVTEPQSVTKTEGKNVTLTCNATGNPVPELSWFNDEHPVKSNNRISLSAGNQLLMIANVNRTDSGKYQCVAHNEVGNASSKVAILNVQCLKLSKMWSKEAPSSPSFSQTSSGEGITAKITLPRFPGSANFFQVIVIRYSLDFTGVVNSPDSFTPKDLMTYEEAHKSSVPAAYVTFQFRGNDFDAFREFVVGDGAHSNSKTKKRRSSDGEDFLNKPLQPNTKYRVFLRAFIDKTVYISSNFVTIETKGKPNVKGLPERTIFQVGDVVVLTCEATGDPKPSVTWSKDGNINIPRAQFRNDGHILVIQEVAPRDGGIYECRALNIFGQRRTATAVIIAVPPSIRKDVSPPSVICAKDTPCTLLCHATSDTPFNYSWTRNGHAFNGRNIKVINNTVIVTPLDDQDFGDYVCHATNLFGSTTYKITLSESLEEEHNVQSIFRAGDIAWSCIVFVLLVLIGLLIRRLRRAQAINRTATAEKANIVDVVQSALPLEQRMSEPASYMELHPRPSDGKTRVPSEYQSLQGGHVNAGYYNVVPEEGNKKGPSEEIYEEIELYDC